MLAVTDPILTKVGFWDQQQQHKEEQEQEKQQ